MAGHYDQEAEQILEATRATGVLVIVVGGTRGDGLSVCTRNRRFVGHVPKILRDVADGIEEQLAGAAS